MKLIPGMGVFVNDRPATLVEILDKRSSVDAAVIRYWDEKSPRVVPLAKVVPAEERRDVVAEGIENAWLEEGRCQP